MSRRSGVAATAFVLICACRPAEPGAAAAPAPPCTPANRPRNWPEVLSCLDGMNEQTERNEIVAVLGEPYHEFDTSSLDERAMYFEVPGAPRQMYWVMIDVHTRRFLYSSRQVFPK
jgi:hypothetical protein